MSRKPEQLVWDAFKRNTDNLEELEFWRIENIAQSGMADVYGMNNTGTSFWLELKQIDSWPVRPSTVSLPKAKFRPGQIPFLKRICYLNGRGFVILRVAAKQEWFLLHPAIMEITEMTRKDMEEKAVCRSLPKIIEYLTHL